MKPTLKQSAAVLALGLAMFVTQAPEPAYAEAEFVIKYADFGADRGPRAAEMRRWADAIKERTNGRVEVEFHFSGSLLSSKNMLQGTRGGVADMGTVVASNNAAELPLWLYGGRPMNEADTWVGNMAWFELASTNASYKEEFERNGVKLLLQNVGGPSSIVCREAAPVTEAQMEGIKMRSSGALGKFFEAMGATVTSISTSDLYSALDRGIIDCTNFAVSYVSQYKYYEVAKTVIMAPVQQSFYYGGVINLDLWNSMPADIQKIIEEESAAYASRLAGEIHVASKTAKENLAKGSEGRPMNVVEMDPAEIERWSLHAGPAVDTWRERARQYSSEEEIDRFIADYESLIAKYAKIRDTEGYP